MDNETLLKANVLKNSIGQLKLLKNQLETGNKDLSNLQSVIFKFDSSPSGIYLDGQIARIVVKDLWENLFEDIHESIARLEKMYAEL